MVAAGDAASFDREVRLAVYRHTVAEGAPPSAEEVAHEVGAATADVETSLRRLADGHVLVLAPGTASIWMAAPFSAIPTPFPVSVGERRYFANCIWDALGVPACLHADAGRNTAGRKTGLPRLAAQLAQQPPLERGQRRPLRLVRLPRFGTPPQLCSNRTVVRQ